MSIPYGGQPKVVATLQGRGEGHHFIRREGETEWTRVEGVLNLFHLGDGGLLYTSETAAPALLRPSDETIVCKPKADDGPAP